MEESRTDQSQERLKPTRLTNFDPDLSPSNPTNRQAAAQRGLRYDSRRRTYVDEDGCLIRDQFGQPF